MQHPDFEPTYPVNTKPLTPPKTTQTHAHSQLPCWFSRTLHTHNKNHLIISTSGTLGFQPLVDTPCSSDSMSVEGIITLLLGLQAGPAEMRGEGRPLTKTQNCFQKPQWINVPEIWQRQADGEQRRVRVWQFDYWPIPDGGPKWRVGVGRGNACGESLSKLRSLRMYMDRWLGPPRTAWPPNLCNPCRKPG